MKAKEYQDIVEEYYPIETIVYGIKNIKQNLSKMVEKSYKGLIKIDYIIYEKLL